MWWSFLLASDLDGTLIPLEPTPGYSREIDRFARVMASSGDVQLAYVTGRHYSLAIEGIREQGLPLPDHLACDVGTSVHTRDGDGFEVDPDYRRWMSRCLGGRTAQAFAGVVDDLPHLVLQEEEKQAEFKRSYYLRSDAVPDETVSMVQDRLDRAGLDCSLVISEDPVTRMGLLDLLPPGVTKKTSLDYFRAKTGLAIDRIAFAGDSGNDVAALISGIRGIVVGNAPEPVKERVRREAARAGRLDTVYFAENDLVAGVIEGCCHAGFLQVSGPGSN